MKLAAQLLLVTGLAAAALGWLHWQAEDPRSLWLTPDQQGRRAYEAKEFSTATDLFEDAMWKGTAGYAAGRYVEAADAFGRLPTATGWFNRGDAPVKGREYVQSVPASSGSITLRRSNLEDVFIELTGRKVSE